jgi:hypothetical protein
MIPRSWVDLLGERTGGYATTTGSWWNTVELGWESLGAVMLFKGTVTTHTGVTSIKDRRVGWVVGPFAPVPVLCVLVMVFTGKGAKHTGWYPV